MRKVAVGFGLGLVLLVGIVFLRTARFSSQQITAAPAQPIAVDAGRAAQSLSQALRFQTISHENPELFRGEEFLAFHEFLAEEFPTVHATLTREVVAQYSLLFTWKGQQESLKPVLLLAHLDVVPVEPGTEQAWTYPAFEGRIEGGYVWGARGVG